jgi:hypothetical protein
MTPIKTPNAGLGVYLLGRQTLYQLSYSRAVGVAGLEPATPRSQTVCATNCATPRSESNCTLCIHFGQGFLLFTADILR